MAQFQRAAIICVYLLERLLHLSSVGLRFRSMDRRTCRTFATVRLLSLFTDSSGAPSAFPERGFESSRTHAPVVFMHLAVILLYDKFNDHACQRHLLVCTRVCLRVCAHSFNILYWFYGYACRPWWILRL